MSVVRSAYRQILRVGARASRRYDDPNDLCFALFGVLLTRHDFMNAGYGGTLPQIAHCAFARPSVAGEAADRAAVRLQASFAVLRRLHELTQGRTPRAVRQRRREVLSSGSSEGTGDGDSAAATASAEPAAAAAEMAGADATAALSSPAATGEVSSAEEVEESVDDDDEVMVGSASIFFERSHNRKVQQEVRHVVMCRDKDRLPPYTQLLPPEPIYMHAVRQDFPFLLSRDAVACIAATSRLLQQQQRRRERDAEAALGYAATTKVVDELPPAPDLAPATTEAYQALLRSIPTRAVARTDCVEVEVCTQFICSTPSPARPHTVGDQRRGGDTVTATAPASPGAVAAPAHSGADGSTHLFLYCVFLRNLSPAQNPKRWHVQVLSQHTVVLDLETNEVAEAVRPGVVGNFPQLAPGESHVFESGARQCGPEAVLRGTIQINAFNEEGQTRVMDVVMPPTRLSTSAREPPARDGASGGGTSS